MEYSLRILYRLVSECEENQIKQYFNDPNVFLAVMNNSEKLAYAFNFYIKIYKSSCKSWPYKLVY